MVNHLNLYPRLMVSRNSIKAAANPFTVVVFMPVNFKFQLKVFYYLILNQKKHPAPGS